MTSTGDNAQTGDIRSRDSAGGDIYHGSSLREVAEILWRMDARIDAQRDEDRRERERRQNEHDLQWEAVRQSIGVMRDQIRELRRDVTAMQTATLLSLDTVERVARRNRTMIGVILVAVALIVVVLTALLYRLWSALFVALTLIG